MALLLCGLLFVLGGLFTVKNQVTTFKVADVYELALSPHSAATVLSSP